MSVHTSVSVSSATWVCMQSHAHMNAPTGEQLETDIHTQGSGGKSAVPAGDDSEHCIGGGAVSTGGGERRGGAIPQ